MNMSRRLKLIVVSTILIILTIWWITPNDAHADPNFYPLPDDFPSTQEYNKLNIDPYATKQTLADLAGTGLRSTGIYHYHFMFKEGYVCDWQYGEEELECEIRQLPGQPLPTEGNHYFTGMNIWYTSDHPDLHVLLKKPLQDRRRSLPDDLTHYGTIPTNSLIQIPLYTTADDIKHPVKVTCLYKENEFLACAMQGEVNTVGFELTPTGQKYWGNNCHVENTHEYCT